MNISVTLPEVNISEEELKILLAIKLLEEGIVSLDDTNCNALID